jgi:ketol-acid reductoisomerase
MLRAVSKTANYGGLVVGPKVIDEHVKENMRRAVRDVQSGKFAKEWIKEREMGERKLKALMKKLEGHQIEKVGRFIRKTAGIEE